MTRQGTAKVPLDLKTEVIAAIDAQCQRRICSRSVFIEGAVAFYLDCLEAGEVTLGYVPDQWVYMNATCPACDRKVDAETTADGEVFFHRHEALPIGNGPCPLSERMLSPYKRGR